MNSVLIESISLEELRQFFQEERRKEAVLNSENIEKMVADAMDKQRRDVPLHDLNVNQAARELGVSRDAIKGLIREGTLVYTDSRKVTWDSLMNLKQGYCVPKRKPGRKIQISLE